MNGHVPAEPLSRGEIASGIPLDDFLPYLMNRIANRLNMALVEDLKRSGVALADYRVLAVLTARNPRTVNELAVYTVTEQSTLSKSLVRMEAAKLIERHGDSDDGRVVNVHITEAGRAAFARIVPFALRHYEQALNGFSAIERKALMHMLHRVLDNIRESRFP